MLGAHLSAKLGADGRDQPSQSSSLTGHRDMGVSVVTWFPGDVPGSEGASGTWHLAPSHPDCVSPRGKTTQTARRAGRIAVRGADLMSTPAVPSTSRQVLLTPSPPHQPRPLGVWNSISCGAFLAHSQGSPRPQGTSGSSGQPSLQLLGPLSSGSVPGLGVWGSQGLTLQ